jgi:NAD-reducing hydrogenase small subunit
MNASSNRKIKFATVWLDGCSGCHMSFLDLDERLIELSKRVEIVYSPLVDAKEFPPDVDVTLVEGSVSSVGDLEKIRHVRERTRILVSLGDCAVTGNVPAMRNPFGAAVVLERGYGANVPTDGVPGLLERVRPVHQVVPVDVVVPGCPPSSDTIFWTLTELLEGRTPDLAGHTRFGA